MIILKTAYELNAMTLSQLVKLFNAIVSEDRLDVYEDHIYGFADYRYLIVLNEKIYKHNGRDRFEIDTVYDIVRELITKKEFIEKPGNARKEKK